MTATTLHDVLLRVRKIRPMKSSRPARPAWTPRPTWPETGVRALQRAGLGGHGGPGRARRASATGSTRSRSSPRRSARNAPRPRLCFGMPLRAAAVIAAKPTDDQAGGTRRAGRRRSNLSRSRSRAGTGVHLYVPHSELVRRRRRASRCEGRRASSPAARTPTATSSPRSPRTRAALPTASRAWWCRATRPGSAGWMRGAGLGMRGNSSRRCDGGCTTCPCRSATCSAGRATSYGTSSTSSRRSSSCRWRARISASRGRARRSASPPRVAPPRAQRRDARGEPGRAARRGHAVYGAVERTRQLLYHAAQRATPAPMMRSRC